MKKHGFSMIELVFVIVVLGILAAVAVPRFVTTRLDAEVATYRSETSNILKSIPARVFAENIDATKETPPTGFSSWAKWMIDTGSLDENRWYGYDKFLSPAQWNREKTQIEVTCGINSTGKAPIEIDVTNGKLIFDPANFSVGTGGSRPLCAAIAETYMEGSNRSISLATTENVKF